MVCLDLNLELVNEQLDPMMHISGKRAVICPAPRPHTARMPTFGNLVLCFVFVLTLLSLRAVAQQEHPWVVRVKNELNASQLTEMKRADRLNADAFAMMEEANKIDMDLTKLELQASVADKKAKKRLEKKMATMARKTINIRLEASETYLEANTLTFHIIRQKNDELKANVEDTEFKSVIEMLEKEAIFHMRDAFSLRRKLNLKSSYKAFRAKTEDIQSLESMALTKVSKITGLYLEWDDVTAEFKGELNPKTDVSPDTVKLFSNETFYTEPGAGEITFSVQILATRTAVKFSDLRSIYKGNYPVIENKINGWYKYSVGSFGTYDEAADYKEKCGVAGAFVVAFKDRRPLELQEALLKSRK